MDGGRTPVRFEGFLQTPSALAGCISDSRALPSVSMTNILRGNPGKKEFARSIMTIAPIVIFYSPESSFMRSVTVIFVINVNV
jgi:hypothetical protein